MNNRIQKICQYPSFLSFVLHFVVIFIAYSFLTPHFQTNDDAGMMLMLAGIGLTDQPTEYIYFINIILAKLLKWLYSTAPSINWYTLLFFLSLFLAYWQVGTMVIKRYPKPVTLGLYLLFFCICGLKSFISLQFTVVASILAMVGFITLFLETKKECISSWVIAFLLIFVSSLIRFESTALMGIICSPLMAWILFEEKSKKVWLYKIAILTFSAGICLAGWQYHQSKYVSFDEDALIFNQYRGQFLDYKRLERANPETQQNALNTGGWTINDYNMLMSWFFMDNKIYNTATLKSILEELPDSERKLKLTNVRAYYFLFDFYTSTQILISLAVCFLFLPFCQFSTSLLVLAQLFITTVCIILINYFLKYPPERVSDPIYAYLSLLPLFFITKSSPQIRYIVLSSRYILYFLYLSMTILIIDRFLYMKELSNWASQNNHFLRESIHQLQPNKQKLYVVWGAAFPYEAISPFENLAYLENLNLFGLGSNQQSQVNTNRLMKFEIKDIYMDLATKENIFLIIYKHDTNFKLYQLFMQEHYQKEVKSKEILSFGNKQIIKIYLP